MPKELPTPNKHCEWCNRANQTTWMVISISIFWNKCTNIACYCIYCYWGPHMFVRHSPSLCERFLVSRAAVTGDAVVLGQLSGSMDGWSGSTVMKSFLWLSNHVGPASLPHSCSSSLVLRAVGRVEMVWKGKWRLALWLFWHTIQALTAQFSAQVIPVQNNRIWLWLNRTFLRLL